jgi:anti-sigma B factor antagonist
MVATRVVQGAVVVSLSGELDALTAPAVRAAILPLLLDPMIASPAQREPGGRATAPAVVVIDLSEVSFLGSSGLGLLVECTSTAEQWGRELRVVTGRGRVVLRALDITAMNQVLALFVELDAALEPTIGANTTAGRDVRRGSALDAALEDTA